MKLPVIAMLWMEGPLSYLEQLCVKSFLDAGHKVVLYHYGPLQNVPDGVEFADANDILPRTNFLTHERTGSPALHSDLFRYRLLEKSDNTIWADTDAYCMKPFETETGHFYGWESDKHINGGVLGMPKDSDALRELLAYTRDEFAIPVWYGEDYVRELEEARDAGNPVHAGEQPWGVWGPHAITHFVHKTGEDKFALPREGLYPITFKDRRFMVKRNFDMTPYITTNTYSVHLYGRRMRPRLAGEDGGVPHRKSLIGRLLDKHNIDPTLAPIPVKPGAEDKTQAEKKAKRIAKRAAEAEAASAAPAKVASATANAPAATPIPASEKYGRGEINLTDLADNYGSDKGSKKHRYSELYQMLFLPYRHQPINFLEMGLQIGGPEHGMDADRKTTDAPSIRMWLEFFPQAQINGLDVSDFSWFEDPRFTFHRCDMDARENIAQAASRMDKFDIVIDDASHASHHQQNGFLELFGKVRSGGLYIIEDLRWQPDVMEKPGITKTADFFQSYVRNGVFEHSDPKVAEEFNALRHDISGCFMFQVQFDKTRKDQIAVIHKR